MKSSRLTSLCLEGLRNTEVGSRASAVFLWVCSNQNHRCFMSVQVELKLICFYLKGRMWSDCSRTPKLDFQPWRASGHVPRKRFLLAGSLVTVCCDTSQWDMYFVEKHHVPLWSGDADPSSVQDKPRLRCWQAGKALAQSWLQLEEWAWGKPPALPSFRLSGSNRRCRSMWLETWLAGVCTCLPKATGLAAGLFPLTLHEHIKKNIPGISISVFSLESTRLWTSHCFLCEDGVLFSCMLNLPRASVFVELQHHLSDFQLCYISGIYFWATWFKMWVVFWEQLIHESRRRSSF